MAAQRPINLRLLAATLQHQSYPSNNQMIKSTVGFALCTLFISLRLAVFAATTSRLCSLRVLMF
jgi:hypothetical protein